jgi:hypothetical protein
VVFRRTNPTLTDVVIEGEVSCRLREPPKKSDGSEPAGQSGGEAHIPGSGPEHRARRLSALKRSLDDQIAGVVRDRFLPEIGGALEQALSRVTQELNASIKRHGAHLGR